MPANSGGASGRRQRTQKLTDATKRKIVLWIQQRGDGDAATWKDISHFAAELCPGGISRQWLCKDPDVFDAYERKRAKRRAGGTRVPTERTSELERAVAANRALRAELARRDEILAQYDYKLACYLENAVPKLTQEQLEAPIKKITRRLPSTDRGKTSGVTTKRPLGRRGH